MKVLLLATEFPPGPGGIGCHAYEIANHLCQLGWQVRVVSPQDYATEEEVRAFQKSVAFSIVNVSALGTRTYTTGLARYHVAASTAKKWQPNVILATGQSAVWLGWLVSRRYRLQWVCVSHGSEFSAKPRWRRLLTQHAFRQASSVVCVSEFTRKRMHAKGIRPETEYVIPNGANDGIFRASTLNIEDRLVPGVDANRDMILLTVGNVSERKGQDVVIKAMPDILSAHPNTHYLIAGLPAMKKELTALAEKLGVGGVVHILGQVDTEDLVRLYNQCDVFVLTSRNTRDGECEGYGIAVIEAALCGKPAVVTRGCGLEEAVTDGVTGLTVAQEDSAGVAQAVISLLQDTGLRRRLGANAREKALQQTWARQAQSYDQILRTVVNGRS